MTESQKTGLRIAARLLAYPDERLIATLEQAAADSDSGGLEPDFAQALASFARDLASLGVDRAAQEYVATFDHASAASLHMSWHRYGNDRSQGKALAAINGLYRTAGFEPVPGSMPDYLPRMLEFFSIAPDWACEALLDGFGPEIAGVIKALEEMPSPYAPILATCVAPLAQEYPAYFQPRSGSDPTRRPMARPEPEEEIMPMRHKSNRPEQKAGRE